MNKRAIREEIKKFGRDQNLPYAFTERDVDAIMSWTDAHLVYLLTDDYYLNREFATFLIRLREDR